MSQQVEWHEKLFGGQSPLKSIARGLIWRNPINPNSLRLNKLAYDVLSQSGEIKFYSLILATDSTATGKTYIQLEKHFTTPYYLEGLRTIHIMDGREVMMLTLLDNDLDRYLSDLEKY